MTGQSYAMESSFVLHGEAKNSDGVIQGGSIENILGNGINPLDIHRRSTRLLIMLYQQILPVWTEWGRDREK